MVSRAASRGAAVMTPLVGCRFCGEALRFAAIDLGARPLANGLVPMDAPDQPDECYPLRLMVCEACWLAQLEQAVDPARMFLDYAYKSSVSAVWREHVARFAATAVERFGLTSGSLVIEVGSNDGILLQQFATRGIPTLGIDPSSDLAEAARLTGVQTLNAFFGEQTAASLAAQGRRADLLVANNVLAHVPGLMDFVRGLALVLAPDGVLSIEVPDVMALLRDGRFDTIYHEHVFCFSAFVLRKILAAAGLVIFDAEVLPTHGGSLRLFARHAAARRPAGTAALDRIIAEEEAAGVDRPETYRSLSVTAAAVIGGLRGFLDRARAEGATVAAYGAAAKGTMLLNAMGATRWDIAFVADANGLKQGHRIPGCRIPVVAPDQLRTSRPDYLLILPWNIADEIMAATSFIADWGGKFVVPGRTPRIVPA